MYETVGALAGNVAEEMGLICSSDGDASRATYDSVWGARRAADGLAETMSPVAANDIEVLLEHLRVEPDSDEDRERLFKLFESNAEIVEQNRTALEEFWADAADDFESHPAVKRSLDRAIAKIDSTDNMGVVFTEGRWFVYDMSVKVGMRYYEIFQVP